MSDYHQLPVVAIVGKPNVGKSTLFNRILGRRRALVGAEPGITRDRNYAVVDWEGDTFLLVDTGGIDPTEKHVGLAGKVDDQVILAIDGSDLVVLVMDLKEGLTEVDLALWALLRKRAKPTILVVNKVDVIAAQANTSAFYQLGVDNIHFISAEHGQATATLAMAIVESLAKQRQMERVPSRVALEAQSRGVVVSLVGRPNVGKSSLLNRILGVSRAIEDESPGTTRDSLEVFYRRHQGMPYTFVDTAGIRPRGKRCSTLEVYSVIKALRSMSSSDVVLLLLDATQGVTNQDRHLASYVLDAGCGCIVLVNKSDLLGNANISAADCLTRVKETLRFLDFAPCISVSAKTGLGVSRIFPLIDKVMQARGQRVDTAKLNRFFQAILESNPPPSKFYYVAQTGAHPPTFYASVNNPERVSSSYKRYLLNQLRKAFGFTGTPMRLFCRKHSG